MNATNVPKQPHLRAIRMGLHALHQSVAVMRTDCHVCHSEGLAPRSQVLLIAGEREVPAMLYQIDGDQFEVNQVALSEAAWQALDICEGDIIQVRHAPVTVGLMFAGCMLLTRGFADWRAWLLAGIAFTVFMTTKLHPLWMIGAGALAGVVFGL